MLLLALALQEAPPLAQSPATPPATPPVASAAAPAAAPATEPAMAPAAVQTATPSVSTQPAADATGASIRDPWEKFNRKVDKFNHAVDKVTMKPVMQVYKGVVPGVARDHISLAIANLAEPVTAINDLLQLHFGNLLKTVTRFGYNSTIGLGGLFDAAAAAGTPGHVADFGQTLGRWGVKPGPYVVLPFFGPSDLRDTLGLAVDNFGDPVALTYMHLTTTQGAVRVGLVITDLRVRLDPALQAAEEAADPYAFARAGYAQHRAALVRQARGEAEVLADYGADPAPADPAPAPAPATPPPADPPASATTAPVSSPAPASVEPPK